jgi:hypothetical protein
MPDEVGIQLKKLQKDTHNPKFGWSAIFMRGYMHLSDDNDKDLTEMNVKIEKLSTRLNFYIQKSVMQEEELNKVRAQRGE